MKVSFLATALFLASTSSALPADNGVTVAKVGDKPSEELFYKRSLDERAPLERADWRTKSVSAGVSTTSRPARKDWRTVTSTTTTTTRAGPSFFPAPVPSSSVSFVPAPQPTTTTPVFVPAPASSSTTTSAPVVSADGSAIATQSAQLPVTTTTTQAPPASTAGANIRSQALDEHNRFRALHGAAPLTWNQNLADAAQSWASRCVFQHSQGAVGPYGENLAANAGTAASVQVTVPLIKLWEDEAPDYTPATPNYSHFTQMVWKSTTEIGCALVVCPPGTLFDARYGNANFLTCEYNPPGNVYPDSNFRANVQP